MTETTSLYFFTFMHWRRKWQPIPVFLPGESQGRGSLVGCLLWGRTESDTTEATQQQQHMTDAFSQLTACVFITADSKQLQHALRPFSYSRILTRGYCFPQYQNVRRREKNERKKEGNKENSKVGQCESVIVAQLCLTLCNPLDCSPPASSVHGILQARIQEWGGKYHFLLQGRQV